MGESWKGVLSSRHCAVHGAFLVVCFGEGAILSFSDSFSALSHEQIEVKKYELAEAGSRSCNEILLYPVVISFAH